MCNKCSVRGQFFDFEPGNCNISSNSYKCLLQNMHFIIVQQTQKITGLLLQKWQTDEDYLSSGERVFY